MGRTLVVGAVPIVGDAGGSLGLFIGWGRIQHLVAVIVQVRWLQAAWGRGPAGEEQDFHLLSPAPNSLRSRVWPSRFLISTAIFGGFFVKVSRT